MTFPYNGSAASVSDPHVHRTIPALTNTAMSTNLTHTVPTDSLATKSPTLTEIQWTLLWAFLPTAPNRLYRNHPPPPIALASAMILLYGGHSPPPATIEVATNRLKTQIVTKRIQNLLTSAAPSAGVTTENYIYPVRPATPEAYNTTDADHSDDSDSESELEYGERCLFKDECICRGIGAPFAAHYPPHKAIYPGLWVDDDFVDVQWRAECHTATAAFWFLFNEIQVTHVQGCYRGGRVTAWDIIAHGVWYLDTKEEIDDETLNMFAESLLHRAVKFRKSCRGARAYRVISWIKFLRKVLIEVRYEDRCDSGSESGDDDHTVYEDVWGSRHEHVRPWYIQGPEHRRKAAREAKTRKKKKEIPKSAFWFKIWMSEHFDRVRKGAMRGIVDENASRIRRRQRFPEDPTWWNVEELWQEVEDRLLDYDDYEGNGGYSDDD